MGQTASQSSPPPLSSCPVQHSQPAQCPVQHVDPRNQMPVLTQEASSSQSTVLPTQRTLSSIPRPPTPGDDGRRNWDYPSPQQFYNALVRKGWETPEEHVETMVDIHNFLNEKAWEEVLRWEENRDGLIN